MSVARITSAHIPHITSEGVTIEVDVHPGLYSFSIVGLPDKAVEESKDRVLSALKNSGFQNPKTENHKVTVSLLPGDVRKEGSHFDVGIALGYLLASKQKTFSSSKKCFVGELSLTGESCPMKGALAISLWAKSEGLRELYVPKANAHEAALVEGIDVYGYASLAELVNHLEDVDGVSGSSIIKEDLAVLESRRPDYFLDFEDIIGQDVGKRALLIAAVGGHNVALFGPPGTGKTMLARAFIGIVPTLDTQTALQVASIHSINGSLRELLLTPPFRSPHHTSSYVSLVGGGTIPRPGEVTLAHGGVLFLDEFPEFDKKVIESLREPLEENSITISRAKGTMTFPAKFTLIAAMNPCPCGFSTSTHKSCTCTPRNVENYRKKISGPIIDRIDMWAPVEHIDYELLSHARKGESTKSLQESVEKARAFAHAQGRTESNRSIGAKNIESVVRLTGEALETLQTLSRNVNLSPRSYHRIMKLARSIADLEQEETVNVNHILEAFQYRPTLF